MTDGSCETGKPATDVVNHQQVANRPGPTALMALPAVKLPVNR